MNRGQFIYRYTYLPSLGWKWTKAIRKSASCDKCWSSRRLQLHHDGYHWHNKHWIIRYFIPNLWDDMRTLCDRCHEVVTYGKKG